MGKITNTLSRLGRGFKNILTSDTTKRVVSGIGTTIAKVAESEIGQRAIGGVVQGIAEATLTDSDYSSAIKKAVIGNVLQIHDEPVDPLNPTEQKLSKKLNTLEREVNHVQLLERQSEKVEEKLAARIEKVKTALQKEGKILNEEENQMELLDTSVQSMLEIAEHENKNLAELNDALLKESRARTLVENRLVEAMKQNFRTMSNVVKAEKDALIEEALEQTIDIGGDISEHLAAEVPFIGESIASGMATARGVMQVYKLGQLISKLTGINIEHTEVPAISPVLVETLLTEPTVNDAILQKVVYSKLKHVEEVKNELEHLSQNVFNELVKKAKDDNLHLESSDTVIHHSTRSNYHVTTTRRPGAHIYTAPFDSDYIVIILVVSPYHQHRAFVLCVDLLNDFIMFQDVSHGGTRVHKGVRPTGFPSFRNAIKDFFKESARNVMSTRMHSERMQRGVGNEPIYITSMLYPYSFLQTRRNAENICRSQEIQRHILRGPLNMQRKSILNGLFHGVTLVTTQRTRSIQQSGKVFAH
uniref:Outer capsid protein VP5 n=1 Tax=Peruvian horse sickness virus TaxID=356862 RepID=A0A7L7Q008_9REOV|nr:VP5 [Peruvian horse sickness virus]